MDKNQKHSRYLVAVLSMVVIFTLINLTWIPGNAIPLEKDTQTSSYLPQVQNQTGVLYTSKNLFGHSIFAECNPGGVSSCDCTQDDAAIASYAAYGEVTSNPQERHTYVNAIGFKKFTENLPYNNPISLGVYQYSGEFRIPVIPAPDIAQRENPQAVHLMIQFWDGRNELLPLNNHTLEGVIYWDLNPWTADKGKIKVYIYPLSLIDTGITLEPDTLWHRFSLVVDLASQKYVSISIDDQEVNLSTTPLAQVIHNDWGTDVSINITTESLASWPQTGCTYIFKWTTQFRNLVFIKMD